MILDRYSKIKSLGDINNDDLEARSVINALPQMKPGMQDGKAVRVIYSLPIIF